MCAAKQSPMLNPKAALDFTPPPEYQKVTVIDAHTAGEPFRVIIAGFPKLEGATILERRRFAKTNYDHLRTALMWEPRGHADMYGCILTPPITPSADFGILFIHNEGFSSMCGHGIIGIATVVIETGMCPAQEPVTTLRIDSPAGLITVQAYIEQGRVTHVTFHNVPSFVAALDEVVDVPGLGQIRYDLAFGGAFYAYVQAEEVGLKCEPQQVRQLIETGMAIKRAVMESRPIVHPFEADLGFLYGTIFVGPATDPTHHSRNVCIFAEAEVDRSPTGTGVSGRLAIHHRRGELGLNQQIEIESLIGTTFRGQVIRETSFGPFSAIIPEVSGSAFLTGRQELWIDPNDPLRHGFLLR